MDNSKLIDINSSPYAGKCIILSTKHQKSVALAPSFGKILSAAVIEHIVDTDKFGTFTGEIERKDTEIESARKKCELTLDATGAEYALASEGSFGTHPHMSFLPHNTETLYFIDRKRNFHLHLSSSTLETNYQMKQIESYEELIAFAKGAKFPSHALILRPHSRDTIEPIFKGIDSYESLEKTYNELKRSSKNAPIWVETDMRAHMNPTRMKNIEKLGEALAKRLSCLCPHCETPGWGKIDIETGLPCEWCGTPTNDVKREILGCTKCDYTESLAPFSQEYSSPQNCVHCNP